MLYWSRGHGFNILESTLRMLASNLKKSSIVVPLKAKFSFPSVQVSKKQLKKQKNILFYYFYSVKTKTLEEIMVINISTCMKKHSIVVKQKFCSICGSQGTQFAPLSRSSPLVSKDGSDHYLVNITVECTTDHCYWKLKNSKQLHAMHINIRNENEEYSVHLHYSWYNHTPGIFMICTAIL